MFWIKTIKQIKEKLKEIHEIKQTVCLQKYQISNLQLDNKIWAKILDNKLKEIEKIQKGVKKKK